MTRAELAALEKVFNAEVFNRLPFQSKALVYRKLATAGYLMAIERQFPVAGLLMTVKGYALTSVGRRTYRNTCRDDPPP